MSETDREIQELLADYADALRDGCIPTFLKSLSRREGRKIQASDEFWDGTEVARVVNSAGFADEAATPDVGLFISRVDARIASRAKRAGAPRRKRSNRSKSIAERQKTEETL